MLFLEEHTQELVPILTRGKRCNPKLRPPMATCSRLSRSHCTDDVGTFPRWVDTHTAFDLASEPPVGSCLAPLVVQSRD